MPIQSLLQNSSWLFLFPLKAQRLLISVVNKSFKIYLHKEQRMSANEQKTQPFFAFL